ncbi:TM2 domain-containing protein [Sphingomonas sp. SUN019]|uniref:TM2 domain-containing protein n=1 Tax=Sphingomonas sp. SUN019 TaxID=2937788 RepID=UPI0021642B04|nr:TM2 domain-containing protein [Sphingomonas sp. SUN019]UVO49050.1 TM2 domain-containing protein [Sphingomonas sp. SUN019]
MRGQVLGVDKNSGEGQISGEDGQRYAFRQDDWSDKKFPAVGITVDFAADGNRAVRVFRVPDPRELTLGERPAHREGSDRNRIVAAVLAFFLGVFGVHKFYLGKSKAGLIMLLCGTIGWLLVLPGLFASITAFIEFIIYLVTSDEEFDRRYVHGDKEWF